MMPIAAGKRAWSPKGRPKSHARDNGYSHAEGGVATSYPAFGAFGSRVKAWFACSLLFAAGLTMANVSVAQITAPGTVVRNTGSVEYTLESGQARTITSNEVSVVVEPLPSRASMSLARYEAASGSAMTAGPTQCRGPSGFAPLASPTTASGGTLDPTQPIPMQDTSFAHAGEPIFVRVVDTDRNRDNNVIETVDVRVAASSTGDSEVLRLSETGPATGVFVGYIATSASASAADCALQVERNSNFSATYVDPVDSTDAAQADALVDPFGLIFDSRSGSPIDGARVRLINAATGQPAAVFGDDGVSRYPSEMVTGQAVTDAGGTQYTFPAGIFRFPLVAPGSYQLEVIPPGSYLFPSQRTVIDLQALPNAPYRLSDGSFGRPFPVLAAPAVAVDIPLDSNASTLVLRKVAGQQIATPGDFVQYTLTLQNTSEQGAYSAIRIVDRMPRGARFRSGSLRLDGQRVADPEIAPDGSLFTYTQAQLAPGATITLKYVLEFTVAMRGVENAINTAVAQAPGNVVSNEARVLVRMNEELFSQKGFIVGRVFEGDCDAPVVKDDAGRADTGVPNIRIYLEDGRYGVTDENGRFHFEGLEPGTHSVQLDKLTLPDYLELAPCGHRMGHAGRDYSQFAELRPGTLWRSDFVLRQKAAPVGDVNFAFNSVLLPDPRGEGLVEHASVVRVTGVPAGNVTVLAALPPGIEYVAGSATVDGVAVADAADKVMGAGTVVVSVKDSILRAKFGELAPGSVRDLRFRTQATPAAGGELPIKAVLLFDSPSKSGLKSQPIEVKMSRGAARYARSQFSFSPRFDVMRTELSLADQNALRDLIDSWRGARDISIHAVGHADAQPISGRSKKMYADNHALSQARAQSVADYLAAALNVPQSRVIVVGRGADEPLNSGKDAASLAANRRVEIVIEGQRFQANAPLEMVASGGASEGVSTQGMVLRGPSTAINRNVRKTAKAEEQIASFKAVDIETLQPGLGWVTPESDAVATIAAAKLAIRHGSQQSAEVTVNGKTLDTLAFDGVAFNEAKTVALSRWRGVALADGENRFEARVVDADGKVIWQGTRIIHYGDGAVRAELDLAASKLVADGRTRPVIALRMFDQYGKHARPGTLTSFTVESPYRSWFEVEQLDDNQILSNGPRNPQVSVSEGGLALIELEPTTVAGNARIHVRFNERQSDEYKVWLAPATRDWILVGIAEDTLAYHTISGNMDTAAAAGREDGFEQDGRVAFFAKGRIKGDFLLTVAYDSARDKEAARERLKGVIEPDRYYLLYGDGTEQRFEAATQDKLYLKLERRQFVALFGDFDTGFTVTELTRYNRTLSGLRSDYAGEKLQATGFAARTDTGLVQDEIPGDGTSGLYRLSRSPVLIGSDKLRIEVRDRFEITRVLETRQLAPFLDYNLDFERGTVFFKQPVQSRDENLNPVFIVADYEVRNGGDEQTSAGMRVATTLAGNKLELGASAVHEGAQTGDSQVYGADLQWRASSATRVRAEIAQSQSDDPLRPDSAAAWLVEARHQTENLEVRAYGREQEDGFGVGQQLAVDGGTRTAGVDARYKLTKELQVDSQVQHMTVLASDATRLLASADVRMQKDNYSLGAGLRHVADENALGEEQVSDLATLTGTVDLGDRITLRGSHDTALGGKDSSVDYPARSIVGVDYKLSGDTTLFGEYEHAEGSQLASDITRFGMRMRPWDRTQVNTSLASEATEYGPRTFANFGLTQGFKWKENWSFDVGVDQTNTLRGPELRPLNPNAPLASGTLNDDFFAAFLGAQYRKDLWLLTSRLEHRNSDTEERWSSTTGWYREPVEGHALSASIQAFDATSALGGESTSAVGRLAWAFRPDSSDWIVFDRLELKYDENQIVTGLLRESSESSRIVNNLHANWQLNSDLQLGLQYGIRYVSSTFEGDKYDGLSDIAGVDMRRQLTRRFDLGAHVAALHSWESAVMDYSAGFDVGMTFAKNVWISLGYNFAGFRDDDFSASRHTAQGPYLKIRIKADQDTFKDLNLDSLRPSR
ncbi:MAG: conserved repeat domain [Steroidobacteraceae bacterium]|nr:conserved repeat domain [Steroidobacteraceae bacterium]